MKIKTQFLISIIVFVIVASIIAASIVVTMQQTNRSNSQSQIAQDVQTRANNLVYVSGDYFLYQDSPDLSLWQTEYSAISIDLSKLSATSSEQKTLLSNIEADAQRLNSSWSNVVSYLQNFPRNESVRVVPAFQDMWSAMSSQNQALIFDAQQLNQNFKTQVDQSNFINIILISALVVLFGAYFVINYLITYRNTLKSISDLQTGIATIGSGNLDYELKGGNNDEVSEISGSVNQMAANLKAVTASKSDLEKEIEERKKAEGEIRRLQDYLLLQVERMPIGLIVWGPDFRVQSWNPEATRIFGFTDEDAMGRHPYELIVPKEAQPVVDDVWGRLLKGDETANSINENITKDGRTIICDWSNTPLKKEDGTVLGVMSMIQDITNRKKAEEALVESEERWSTTLSSIGDAVIATDVEGKITFMNNVAQALTGCSLADAAHKPLQEIFHIVNEDTRSEVENPVLKVLRNGAIVGLANHSVLIRRDGSEVPIDDSGSPIRDPNGQVTGVVLVFHDITERKKAEAQLERQAELINLDPDAILARKPDGTITFWSCGAERLYGYTEEEALGQVSQRLLGTRFPADFELKDIIEQIKTTGAWSGELVQRTKDPREITVQSHWAIRVGENNEIEFLESNVDVTDRVQLQERLEDKAAEVEEYATRMEELVEERTNRVKRQASLIDLTPDAIMVRDFDGNISFWSAGAEKLYGWTAKEAVGQVSQDLLKTIFLDPVLDITARIEQAGSWTGELRQKTKDGREVVVESRWLAEKNQMGRIIDILESNVDITERKKAEVAVQSERQRLYDVLETMPAMVCLITPDYHIAFANLSFRERFGESKGRPCYEYCWGQSEPCKFCESLVPFTTGKPHNWEVTGPDGTVIEAHDYPFTDVDGKQLVLEMDIDITARKKAEAQAIESARKLKDAERLAAIGATAGMVGHDIRNPLQAITGDVYLAKSELDALPDSEEKKSILECLDETEKNIDYINKIVQDLQDYARPLNPRAEESDLRDVLEKMVSKNRLPSSIKVKIQVAEEARKISADSYYLNRILYNLFTNAVQAMPKGGKLTLKAERVAGETVITIQDTGVGIPKDIQPKLFTIMFTTKSKGQGFGLPVVKRMIESLGGTVTFESLEGKGTTFTIRLPVKNQ